MKSSRIILIASEHDPELQNIIQATPQAQAWTIDRLDDEADLLTRLTEKSYNLAILDFHRFADWFQPNSLPKSNFRGVRHPQMPNVAASEDAGSSNLELLSLPPSTALLLLVTMDKRQQALDYLQQTTGDYLLLPVDAADLIFKVKRLLELQHLQQNAIQPDSGVQALLKLNDMTQEMMQTLELNEALNILLTQARYLTNANSARLYLSDSKGNLSKENQIVKTSAADDDFEEDDPIFALAQQSALSQQIQLHTQTWPTLSLKTILTAPLISREKLIGVLAFGSTQESHFTQYHRHWISVFCDQAAIAVENARLFQDLSSAYIDLAQSREKILRHRNTLQVIFDGITDGLYILDQELIIHSINRVEAQSLGFDNPDQLIGQSYLSLEWVKSAPTLIERIRNSLKTGQETTWISSENEGDPYLKDREFHIYPVRNRLAQSEQVVIFAQDVSERRRWQASLFRSANLAAVGQLAGSVAHQINNPLTVTMTNSQLILLDVPPDIETHELASEIFKAGERIQNIVTNLLEFSNQEQYFFVETNLVNTIEGALALVIRSLKKGRIQVVKQYNVQPMLSASVSHLKLVWINLLLNARDAVIDFADKPQITIATETVSDREVKVIITDNGVGVQEKDFEHLFRPFYTTKPVGKALGLGLYSAHAIIERHHGKIEAISQPGVSTSFEVTLPLDNPRDL